MHEGLSSPFCEAKGGRGERSETQGVHSRTAARLKTPLYSPFFYEKRGGIGCPLRKRDGAGRNPPFAERKGVRGMVGDGRPVRVLADGLAGHPLRLARLAASPYAEAKGKGTSWQSWFKNDGFPPARE